MAYIKAFFEAKPKLDHPSHIDLENSAHQMVTEKIQNLKNQEEALVKTIHSRVDQLTTECLETAKIPGSQVPLMVNLRLDFFREYLENMLLKLKDAPGFTGQRENLEGSSLPVIENYFTAMTERVEKLEKACQLNEATCALCSKSVDDMGGKLEEVTLQLEKNVSDVGTCLAEVKELKKKQASTTSKMDSAHKQMDALETKVNTLKSEVEVEEALLRSQVQKSQSMQKTLQQRANEVEAKMLETSKSVEQRVSNLERLRDILNQKRSKSAAVPNIRELIDDTQGKIGQIVTEINNLRSKVSHVGFTTKLVGYKTVSSGEALKATASDIKVISNVGNFFQASEGYFVTPETGIYCFCVEIKQFSRNSVSFQLMVHDVHSNKAESHLEVSIRTNEAHSAVCVLRLNAQDRVFLVGEEDGGPKQLDNEVTFSGWSIGYL